MDGRMDGFMGDIACSIGSLDTLPNIMGRDFTIP
jgi:hypothetical protein